MHVYGYTAVLLSDGNTLYLFCKNSSIITVLITFTLGQWVFCFKIVGLYWMNLFEWELISENGMAFICIQKTIHTVFMFQEALGMIYRPKGPCWSHFSMYLIILTHGLPYEGAKCNRTQCHTQALKRITVSRMTGDVACINEKSPDHQEGRPSHKRIKFPWLDRYLALFNNTCYNILLQKYKNKWNGES